MAQIPRPKMAPEYSAIQRRIWNSDKRLQLWIGAQRSGKTKEFLDELIDLSMRFPGSHSYYIGPNFPVMKPHEQEITDIMTGLGILASHNRQDHIWMSIHQGMIQFKTAEKPESIKGWDCDLVILDEASNCQDLTFTNALIATNVRSGRLKIGSNVPEPHHLGYDWVTRLYDEWSNKPEAEVGAFPAWANSVVYPGGRDDPKIKMMEDILPPDIFARRIGGDMRVLTGLVYSEFDPNKHIVPDITATKCCVSIDPAYSSIASIHFYDFNGQRLIAFDEVYRSQLTDPDIVHIVANYPIRPEFVVYDSEDPNLGKLLEEAGLSAIPADKGRSSVHEGIMIVKTWFHQGRIQVCRCCEKLIWELRRYAFHKRSETPIKAHDHACDDLRYLVTTLDASERRQADQEIHIREELPRIELGQEPTSVWI